MNTNNSEFYHFGIIPEVCIHSLDEDQYSKMYIPEETCLCGGTEWIESTMKIVQNDFYPKKRIHRCKSCDGIRMAKHIGIKQ